MRNRSLVVCIFSFTVCIFIAGCATTKPRRPSQADLESQVAALQSDIQAKDQQIQDLQYQLESSQRTIESVPSTNFNKSSSVIRVPGVTATAVQKALLRAGVDPGPVDGRIGKKTKTAIKEFQKRNALTADGIVGERTWTLLNS